MIIDETTEIRQNAERYAAKRYRTHAAKQRRYLESAYNAAPISHRETISYREVCSNPFPESPVSPVTAQTSIPALDYVKRVARLYAGPVTPTTLRELDHETTQIAIMGFKAIACVGLFLTFLAMTIG